MPSLKFLLAPVVFLMAVAATVTAAERIVTLGAPVTETVFALGAGGEVIARDASSLYPEAAVALPDVGYFRTIGAEGVLARKPTLILAAYGTGPERQVALLKDSGVRFVSLDARPSAESTLAMIAEVGRIVDRPKEAAELEARLRARFAEAAALARDSARKPKVVFLMGVDGSALQAAGDGTAATALIGLAGGVNPLSGFNGYMGVTPEAILAADPDFILYAKQTYGGADALSPESAPAWLRSTRAMREGRVRPLLMTYHLVFGPRLGDAALDVARMLHAP